MSDENVLQPWFSSNAVRFRSEEGGGAVKIPGAIIGALISRTEIIEFRVRSRGSESNFTAFKIGDVNGAEVSLGGSGGLEESGGEGGAVGDLVEFSWIEVVE
ncbi:hypothetical protein Lal_00032416 [Lupinus albus]|nr:hypothetical protein Lal_00032416 [Lupinus albus]